MSAAAVSMSLTLEAIARCTWSLVRDAAFLGASIGEETLTDLLSIKVKRGGYRVMQFSKARESLTGVDIALEVWLGNDRMQWVRLAIQAKKLNVGSYKYHSLDYKSKTDRQLNMLEQYAQHGTIPLYLLYNYKEDADKYWHCSRPVDIEQMGCTIAPLFVIKESITSKKKGFDDIHKHISTFPMRCLAEWPIRCNYCEEKSLYLHGTYPRKYDFLPSYLRTGDESLRDAFISEFYSDGISPPRRLWVLNVPEEDNA